ncbi:sigma-54 interaction domain-containing protein [Thiolapillus sp.]
MNKSSNYELLGKSPEFEALLRSLDIAAVTDVTLILTGESGTGKELLARHVHKRSRRNQAPFVAINCAALPEGLAESELFGHIKGAFTGAVADNLGRISMAEGGTLFLDEIGEMSLDIQAKLLRFLESGEYQPVGSLKQRQANVRLVAATNADLRKKVDDGSFREDLYYRLNIIPFHVPALRERTGDVELLIPEITKRLSETYSLPSPTYSKAAMDCLKRYAWPGNIRELRNLCERMLILFSGREISDGNLPREIRHQQLKRWTFALPDAGIKLDELEQELLQQALEKSHGNQSKAARILGLSRYAFMYRLKKYQLQ